jgi:hypothetical protein
MIAIRTRYLFACEPADGGGDSASSISMIGIPSRTG